MCGNKIAAWRWLLPLLAGVLLLTGCHTAPAGHTGMSSLPMVWGSKGAKPGEFIEPRAVAMGPRDLVYIVDSTGRVQEWDRAGRFHRCWMVPNIRYGRPEGVAVWPDGTVAVADTHVSRVRLYRPDGHLLASLGHYGRDRGGFLLVTAVCVAPDGTLYCSDYGGDFNRVSHWTRTGRLLASWARSGAGPGQFRRPCGLAISREGHLLVADIGNHRVQRLDARTGGFLGQIGQRGKATGQLNYPYGVAVDSKGNIYTVEYGTHRVQIWSAGGKWLAVWGGPGRTPGKLATPWGLAVDGDGYVYVADTGNHRIQKFRSPVLNSPP